jgi:nitroreductase
VHHAAVEFHEVLRRRRMVRDFDEGAIDGASRDRILASALRGPSAGFSQGFEFLVLEGADDRRRFWSVTWPEEHDAELPHLIGMRRAPLLVAVLSNKQVYLDRYAQADKGWTDRDEKRWPVPYWDIDAGMAALLMLLTVVDEGLGACFFGIQPTSFDGFRAAFSVPEPYTPIGALCIGHRAGTVGPARFPERRRERDDVMHFGTW